MPTRDHQCVPGVELPNIHEGHCQVILVDDAGGTCSLRDFAKHTGLMCSVHLQLVTIPRHTLLNGFPVSLSGISICSSRRDAQIWNRDSNFSLKKK